MVKVLIQNLHIFYYFVQFSALEAYVESGGSVLVMLGEGGELRFETNINYFLEEYGIMVNNGKIQCMC